LNALRFPSIVDKAYKSIWVAQVKAGMRRHLPSFSSVAVPTGHPDREVFVGTMLYRDAVRPGLVIWLGWQPGRGVERCFNVCVGWSPSVERLPCLDEHDRRIYSLRGPDPMFEAAALDLEQIEGKSAIGHLSIASPWDRLLAVKATAPKAEMNAAIQKAYGESLALGEEERAVAVSRAVTDAFDRVQAVLPRFLSAAASGESAV
jgi:hypothetical protein